MSETSSPHIASMNEALLEAHKALLHNEVPVGAIITDPQGQIIARAFNLRETNKNPLHHAEILAIEQACRSLQSWRLSHCTLYVTLEPCFMCAGAIVQSRISTVVFGAWDPKGGAVGSLGNVLQDNRLNHRCHIVPEVLKEESSQILKDFFRKKRSSSHAGILPS